MPTDEEGETTQGTRKMGLEELFSGDGEDAEDLESGTDTDSGATGTGGGFPLAPEDDDAEILTDSSAETGTETPERDGATTSGATESTQAGESSVTEPARRSSNGQGVIGPTLPQDAGDAELVDEESPSEAAERVKREAQRDRTPPATAKNRLTTGIPMLDRELEGGIPPGRMLSLVAPPETQSELLVKEMAISRPTVYISTFRPEWEIREELHDYLQQSDDEGLLDNELRVSYVDPEDLLANPMEYIGDLPNGSNLVIDSINEFELEDRKRYVKFLNTVKEVLWDTGSVGLFYGIEESTDPPARSLTLKRSDIVWQLDRSVTPHEIQTILVISKFRGGKALTEPVKLVLTDDVQVDMSRDIG